MLSEENLVKRQKQRFCDTFWQHDAHRYIEEKETEYRRSNGNRQGPDNRMPTQKKQVIKQEDKHTGVKSDDLDQHHQSNQSATDQQQHAAAVGIKENLI